MKTINERGVKEKSPLHQLDAHVGLQNATANPEGKYEIPEGLVDVIDEHFANLELRDKYISLPFGYKKAVKCTVNAEKKSREFWKKVNELYPSLVDKKATYQKGTTFVKLL
jgi:hypothetical protein